MLSTPASRTDRFARSHKAGADISMADLEDSIAPRHKDEARRLAEGFFTAPTAGSTRCAVRINAVSGPDGLRDLLAIREYRAKPAVIVIPKVESPRDVEIIEDLLLPSCPDVQFLAVVETPRGLENAPAVAASSARMRALVFGSADYSFAVGARLSWDALLHARSHLVNSARGAGIEVIDAPTFEVDDAELLGREAALAGDLGFSGKVAIHPRQIPVINEVFSPDAATLARARRIVDAAGSSADDVSVVDGSMVGVPFFEASRRLVEEFEHTTETEPLSSTLSRKDDR
ncbi:HpcH/HpaI aldolase/citrate lyase family protein [Streptomyces asiaticus]|uniref:HpcH/HpaI aldolase/citrate lyase family protein n=1 Tax=Streptomyces asiaticus TaxID=114695 RepID=UPI003F66DCA4